MENYNLYLIKNLLALTVIGFIIAPANVNVTKDILTKPIPDVSLNLSTTEPVDLDFDAILERGSIRVITNYNVGSYFLQGGLDRGFEYEFLAMFARQHGLTVEVILLQPGDDPVEVLNRGAGDIIATNFIKTSLRERQVTFSEPYKIVDQHIILPDTSQNFTSLAQLDSIPISVQRNSAQHEILLELKEQGYAFTIDLVSPEFDKEALVVGVAENRYKATIADDHQFNAMKTYVTGVQLGPRISEAVQVGWGIRQNAEKLQKEVDKYVYGNFKHDFKQEKIWKSGYFSLLEQRYYHNQTQIEQYRNDIHELMYHGIFSPYDHLIRPAAEQAGVDWKLAVAVMAQESAFRPNAVSVAGALGLMQIIPRFSQISDEAQLMDPEINIGEGMRYLKKHLTHYSYLDKENQLALSLAAYNAGMGHVADARRLVIDSDKNPNDWEAVSEALLKLVDRKHYQHARYGFVRGTETVDYVQRIRGRYKTYQAISQLANNTARGDVEETLLAMGKMAGK